MKRAILFVACAALCGAQTIVNGGRDYKGTLRASGGVSAVDFSDAGGTAPAKAGSSALRPTGCVKGQIYFATDATAGQNLYFCTAPGAPGVWTQMSGTTAGSTTGGAGAPSGNCTPPIVYIDTTNQDLWFCGATNSWKQPTTATAAGIAGGSSGQVPFQTGTGATNFSSGFTYNDATKVVGLIGGYAAGQSGIATGTYKLNGTTSGTVTITGVSAAGTWTMTLPTSGGSSGQFLQTNGSGGTTWATVAASGITAMTAGATDPIAPCTAPSTSNLVLYTETTTQELWACVATNTWKKVLSTTNSGTYTATGAVGTAPSNPESGSVACYYSSVSLTQICLDALGNAFSTVKTATGRTANQFVTHIAANGIPVTAPLVSADIPANAANTSGTAAGLSGLPADPTKFYNGAGAFTVPTGGLAGTAPYSCAVSSVSSIACTHNLGTATPWVACYDGSGNLLGSTGAATSVTSVVATSANVATLTFSGSTTATCLISTGSMGPVGTAGTTGLTGNTGAPGTNGAMPDPGANGVMTRTALNTTGVVSGTATNCVLVNGTSGPCGSGGGPIGVLTYKTANWTNVGAIWTALSMDTIDSDSSAGTLWAIGAPTRFIAPSAGRYTLRCGLYSDTSWGGTAALRFQLNGATSDAAAYGGFEMVAASGLPAFFPIQAVRTFNLAANDFVQCQYFLTASVTMNGGKNKSFAVFFKEAF